MKNKIIIMIVITSLLMIGSFASATDWTTGVSYSIGDIVNYNGQEYICIQSHTSQAGWTPIVVPALWSEYETPVEDGLWHNSVEYVIGDRVEYNNQNYICKQSHTSQNDWTPNIVPALWETNINPTYSDELKDHLEMMYNQTELLNWEILNVDKSIRVISYDITLENKQTGEVKTTTWFKKV